LAFEIRKSERGETGYKPMSKRILLIEDDTSIADVIKDYLEKQGYEVDIVTDGEEGLAAVKEKLPDLILLDLMLPGMPGLDVCKEIRKNSNIPIIMLTAKTDEVDKIIGLEFGADDYITKPFSFRELVARIRAVMRRTKTRPPVESPSVLQGGDVVMDIPRRKVTVRGKVVHLPMKQFDLLRALMIRNGEVIERDKLFEEVWRKESIKNMGTLDVHVRWLREKIEEDPARPKHVRTVRGVGYKFVGDEE